MSDLFDLTGKTVVITGGGGVLCGGIARHLAGAGANVALLDLNRGPADEIAREIIAAGGKAIAVVADVQDARRGKSREDQE